MVDGKGVLEAVRRDVARCPGTADVVHENIEARVRLEDLSGEAAHLGLGRQIRAEREWLSKLDLS